MQAFLNIAIPAIRQASKIVSRYLDHSWLPQQDKNPQLENLIDTIEDSIARSIQKAYPEHAVLTPRSDLSPSFPSVFWLLNPISGLDNFLHQLPCVAMSLTLVMHNHIHLGVVYDLLSHELFTATRGGGAHLNNRRIRVNPGNPGTNILLGTASYAMEHSSKNRLNDFFQKNKTTDNKIRIFGSTALSLAYVAAGRLDAFWNPSASPWDIVAGALLVTEAGGLVGSPTGKWSLSDPNTFFIAGAPKSYTALMIEMGK